MKLALSVVALGASLTTTGLARGQPPQAQPAAAPPSTSAYSLAAEAPIVGRLPKDRLAAPTNAFELSVGTGYTQGFGSLKSGVGMPSVATPGIGIDLGLGYRIDPKWAVLWSGEYQELDAQRAAAARGFTTSLAFQYHFAPLERLDPWVEGGGGLRFLWEDVRVGPTLLTYGFQLVRVRAGLDFRTGEAAAIGPMIGADVTMFAFQDSNVSTVIDERRVSTFVFAGLQGRFDAGGSTRSLSPPPSMLSMLSTH